MSGRAVAADKHAKPLKQERGQATIERVLDAALKCFTRAGVQGATISEIAAVSGVSIGSIYHHFGSRERVLFELYRRCLEAMLAHITEAVVGRTKAKGGVRALVSSYLEYVAKHPDESRLIYAAAHTELIAEFRPELEALAARVTTPIADWLKPHIEQGAVIDLPPPLLEVVLIGPPAEAARRILSGVPGLSFESARATLPDLVWASVAKRKSERRWRSS